MPRPKVRAEDRRRAVKACVPCQNSKKRCDSQSPCANCRRRDCIPYCIYDPEAARPRRLSSKAHRRRIDQRSDTASSSNDTYSSLDYIVCSDVASTAAEHPTPAQVQAPHTPESTQGPLSNETPDTAFSSCMSNIGPQDQSPESEKVSMGDSASLSFLDFLRHTFLYYMGPSPFTDKEKAKAMLESVFPQASDDIAEDCSDGHLSLEEKRDYIQRFLIATTGIIYIYSPEQMFKLLEETEEIRGQSSDASALSESRQKGAIIDLAIAIGGQGCRTTPKSLYHAQKHFDRGQKLAFEGMLLDPTGDLVAIFLMMSIYTLCASPETHRFSYRGRLVPRRIKSNGQFLSQIFVLDQEKSGLAASDPDGTTFASATASRELDDEPSEEFLLLQQAAEATQSMGNIWRIPEGSQGFVDHLLSGQASGAEPVPITLGGFDIHWNGISVQGTDNFLFDTEPFNDMLSHF
ncbi:putative transcriptional regulatory protein C3C7.04 [Fusarium austroafricanum]|uniref:Putative transcriptional regulatory protein C3C7.04 n=1 Tax=Fusarium austroafricanum TaxID=2364996 RepID=A0A8H4KCK2_9HYPO|nr:putative transcriptional regulatory protein C3C7.04 [Fusarium austroafricanum]